jgi:hypothetical protein
MNNAESPARRNRNYLPSIADMVFLGIFFLLALSSDERLLGDADTGYHIRAGEFIIKHLKIPSTDIFSYWTPPLPWTLHEWMSEVIMAVVHRASGLTGVVIFFAFVVALGCYLIFKLLLAKRGNLLFATATCLLIVSSSSSNWLARPHVITFVFFVIWYHLLNGYQYRNVNNLFYLPLIMLFWVNLHGGFILGLILLSIYWIGNCINFLFAPFQEKSEPFKKIRFLTLIGMACAVAALCNPHGYHSLLFPFQVVQNKFLMDHISEYLSPNFHLSSIVPFEILLLATVGIFAISSTKLDIVELMLMLLFGHMALFSSRHIPLFAIIAGPIVLKQADMAFHRIDGRFLTACKARLENLATIDQRTTPYIWPLASVLLVVGLVKTGSVSHSFNPKYLPVEATEFFKKEKIPGNMFNNDEFGDYIIYAAWPEYKVFMDGRTDMYGAARVREYVKITQAETGWESLLDQHGITWVIHDPNSVLSKVLLLKPDWQLIYADEVADIFVRRVPENNRLIEKYQVPRAIKKQPIQTEP